MEHVHILFKAPVRRRPQRAFIGSRHPRAGNPVVAIVAVCPVSRTPHQAGFRTWRLLINRQHRRSEADTDKHTRIGRSGNQRKKRGEHQPARRTKNFHGEQPPGSFVPGLFRKSNRYERAGVSNEVKNVLPDEIALRAIKLLRLEPCLRTEVAEAAINILVASDYLPSDRAQILDASLSLTPAASKHPDANIRESKGLPPSRWKPRARSGSVV